MQSPNEVIPFTGYQKFIIFILALLQFSVILDFMVMSPLGDMLMKSLLLSPSQFGAVVSAYAFSAGASGILAAGFADKYDRKNLLLFFYVGFIVGTVLCGISNSYLMLLFARIVTGIFGGVIGSMCLAIVSDIFLPNQRGRVMGFIQMAFAGSQILGIPISLFLANIWGWNAPFFMIVGVSIVLGVVVLRYMQPVDAHLMTKVERNPLMHLWKTVQNTDYLIGFGATAMLSIGGFMLMPFGSAFLVNNVGILQKHLLWVYMATGISSMIVMPMIGKLSDKYSKFTLFAIGSVVSIVMVIIYTNMGISPLWKVTLVNMVLFMGIMSRIVPLMAMTSSMPEMRDRGAFMSINSSMQQMAGGVASIVAGLIVVQPTKSSPLQHFDWVGYLASGVILLCIYLGYRVQQIVQKRSGAVANAPKAFS